MIHSTEFHYEFLKGINRVNSDYNKSFSVAARDSYINRAKDVVFENFFAMSEMNTTIRNHLKAFEKKDIQLERVKEEENYNIYKYPAKFYRLLRQNAIFHTKECDTSRKIIIRIIQSDDINEALSDPYWEPSFEWGETLGDEGSEGFYVYKKPDHIIEKVVVDYMTKPSDIVAPSLTSTGSYKNSKGERVSQDSHFYGDTYLWRKIVDVSVLFALRDLGQVDDFSSKMQEIISVDKLYIN